MMYQTQGQDPAKLQLIEQAAMMSGIDQIYHDYEQTQNQSNYYANLQATPSQQYNHGVNINRTISSPNTTCTTTFSSTQPMTTCSIAPSTLPVPNIHPGHPSQNYLNSMSYPPGCARSVPFVRKPQNGISMNPQPTNEQPFFQQMFHPAFPQAQYGPYPPQYSYQGMPYPNQYQMQNQYPVPIQRLTQNQQAKANFSPKPSFRDIVISSPKSIKATPRQSFRRQRSEGEEIPENNQKKPRQNVPNNTQTRHSSNLGEVPPLVVQGDIEEYLNFMKLNEELYAHFDKRRIRRAIPTRRGTILIIPKTEEDRVFILNNFPSEAFKGKANIREAKDRPKVKNCIVINSIPQEMKEGEILSLLKESELKVVTAQRMKNRHGMNTTLVKIEMESEEAMTKVLEDETITFGFIKCKVKKFTPFTTDIKQCYKCQEFDHLSYNCPNQQRCIRCGDDHRVADCTKTDEDVICPNCKGNHRSTDKNCPARKEHIKRIVELRQENTPNRNENQSRKSSPQGAYYISPSRMNRTYPPLPSRQFQCKNCTLKSHMENETESITALLLCTILGARDLIQGNKIKDILTKMQSLAARIEIKLDVSKMLEVVEKIKSQSVSTDEDMEILETSDDHIEIEEAEPTTTTTNHE